MQLVSVSVCVSRRQAGYPSWFKNSTSLAASIRTCPGGPGFEAATESPCFLCERSSPQTALGLRTTPESRISLHPFHIVTHLRIDLHYIEFNIVRLEHLAIRRENFMITTTAMPARFAPVLLMIVMAGAFVAHLTVLGSSPAAPIMLFILSGIIANLRKP
jgi:hypothetical protein